MDPGIISFKEGTSVNQQQGWKAALDLLMPMKESPDTVESSPAQASHIFLWFIFLK